MHSDLPSLHAPLRVAGSEASKARSRGWGGGGQKSSRGVWGGGVLSFSPWGGDFADPPPPPAPPPPLRGGRGATMEIELLTSADRSDAESAECQPAASGSRAAC